MKIKTKLQVSIILTIILSITVGLSIYMAIQSVKERSRTEIIAAEIVKGMAELNIITHEYLLHPGERSMMQWQSRYDSLIKTIPITEFKRSKERIILNEILQDLSRFKAAFTDVSKNYGIVREFGGPKMAISPELRNILIGELLVKSQASVSPVFQFQKAIQADLLATHQRAGFLVAIFLIIFTILIITISLWINRSIGVPIAQLERGTQIIGAGNLDHKVGTDEKDEIGQLSRAFDRMTDDLRKTTTSIVDLNSEIDERKKAEEALRESEEKYRELINGMSDTAWIIDFDANFIYVNDAAVKVLGYSRKELLSMGPQDIDTSLDVEEIKGLIEQIPTDEIQLFETTHTTKDGKTIPVEVKSSLVTYQGKQVILSIARDITERKQTEKALRQSEEKLARSRKMESLGLLAGGVAHDLNNVLSGIVSYPDLLLMDLPEDSKLRKPIETIQESGHRAAAIVQDLLTVARGVATTKEPLNLNDIVSDYLVSPEFKTLKQFHPTVTVKTNLDTDLFNIGGSHVHIRKVVMNLVANASEAIEGGGNVTISTMNRYIDRSLRGYDDVTIGEYAVLAVSDDGSGISSDDLERIFEPFYTKKVMSRSGTGLGLAVVWNVVQDHKGYIDMKSDENGTTFELYFPITRDEISDKALSIPIKDYKGNGETILVVDDVESQREISCNMLDTLGYKTKAVSSGEEAVEYLKEHTVDLLLLDMIMDPGINGRETYERIITIHPNQKAIIVSGFAETDRVKEAQRLGAGKYIKKPYTLEKIGLAVKEELEK